MYACHTSVWLLTTRFVSYLVYGCCSVMTHALFCAQLNGANPTYLDVCPLLEPSPSTPTGDYVQPVNVDRDIELQTRNLPAPVSLIFGIYIHCVTFHLLSIRSVDLGISAVWKELLIFQLSTTMRAHSPVGSTKTR